MTTATHTFLDAIRHLPVGGALSIPDVPWADYEALLTELGDGYARSRRAWHSHRSRPRH